MLAVVVIGFSACQMPSRVAMEGEGGRTAYNVAIQSTNSQQMLLNLIRLRYADSPLFLDVSSITTQSTIRSEVAPYFSIPGFNQDNPFRLGTELSWQDQPTITYMPLEGRAFASRLLRPVDLRTLQMLCYSGGDVDRIFWMMIQNFGDLLNEPESAESTSLDYQRFSEFSQLLRQFQRRGELQLGVQVSQKTDKDRDPDELSLQIAFPVDGEAGSRLAELLRCNQKVNGRYLKNIELGFTNSGHMGIMLRSILSCMSFLSWGVEVPQEHVECHMVRSAHCHTDKEWNDIFHELINVHSSKLCPKNAFIAVQYRNYWFYIDDGDVRSKKTFGILLQLYNLNADESKNRGPILTLPLG